MEIVTLALRRANVGGDANILDYIPEGITLLPILRGHAMPRKPCVSPGSPGNLAAGILSKLRLSTKANT